MDNDEKYKLIFDTMQNGTVEDWENRSNQFPDFPNRHEMLQLLIDNGADVNIGSELGTMGINSWSPLLMAAARNDLQAIKILLNNGADTTLKTLSFYNNN